VLFGECKGCGEVFCKMSVYPSPCQIQENPTVPGTKPIRSCEEAILDVEKLRKLACVLRERRAP
jgi:hypothetical protein